MAKNPAFMRFLGSVSYETEWATISLLLDCVSYEILCETRIKPSFFGNCLIFLFPALGPSAWALNSRQWQLAPLVLIELLVHVRGRGGLPSPPSFGGHLPQRGRRDLAPPSGELAPLGD